MPLDAFVDASLPAQVFGRSFDMWTNRATDLLDRLAWRYVFVDLDDPRSAAVIPELIKATSRYQTPYVFLHGKYVGGFAELDELERLGQLDPEPLPGRIDVVVAARREEFVPPGLKKGAE